MASKYDNSTSSLNLISFLVVVFGFVTVIISCLGLIVYEKRRKKENIFGDEMKNLSASPDKISIRVCSACAIHDIKNRVHDILA